MYRVSERVEVNYGAFSAEGGRERKREKMISVSTWVHARSRSRSSHIAFFYVSGFHQNIIVIAWRPAPATLIPTTPDKRSYSSSSVKTRLDQCSFALSVFVVSISSAWTYCVVHFVRMSHGLTSITYILQMAYPFKG